MDSLPDAVVQHILCYLNNAKDVASCTCVSKKWLDYMRYTRSLFFPRNCLDNYAGTEHPDCIIWKMILSVLQLEELVVYCPFSCTGLSSWLSIAGDSLRHLELRMDSLPSSESCHDALLKIDSIVAAKNLESLMLWGVFMSKPPRWNSFEKLRVLQIIGAVLEDPALSMTLQACPYLTHLTLLGCEGLQSLSIGLPYLQGCKFDIIGSGNCSLFITTPQLESLEVHGCSWISVRETQCLKNLSIANSTGMIRVVDFGKLASLEFLSIRGVQWRWDAVSKLLHLASEVKHLDMKIEFTGDFDALLPFPEIDFVDFFDSHPKLRKFEIHGAMFAALCRKNSLKNLNPGFVIPCLEEVVITVRSPLNADQKMITLESLVEYGKRLKKMVIKSFQMKSGYSSIDNFFEDLCRFRHKNRKIVQIV